MNLSSQSLKSLPEIPMEIYKLDASKNELEELDFTQKLNLSMLNLSKNQLTNIKQLENLENLTVLNLSFNAFKEIPNGIPIKLKALILNHNSISKVDNLSLDHLNTLVLSNNQISQFENFSGLGLKKLSIGHNKLSEFPSLKTPDLRELRVNDNLIPLINMEQVNLIPKLEILDLGNNAIQEFRDLIHLMSLKLRQLNLKGNPICSLEGYETKIRKMLPSLWILDGKNLKHGGKKKTESNSVLSRENDQKKEIKDDAIVNESIEVKQELINNTMEKVDKDTRKKRKIVDTTEAKSGLVAVSFSKKKAVVDQTNKEDILKALEEKDDIDALKW